MNNAGRQTIIGAALALALAAGLATPAALAGLITYIDAPGTYDTACVGGVVGVVFGGENDIIAECAYSDTEQVLCGLPGVVDWQPLGVDQITVTCESPK